MQIFEYENFTFSKQYQDDPVNTYNSRCREHKNNIDAIFTASIAALDFIKDKSPFSIKKLVDFRKTKKKLIRFKKMNINNQVNIYEIVNIFYNEFEQIKTNSLSGSESFFAYRLNNLLLKVKIDLIDNYENFVKIKFMPEKLVRRNG